MEKNPFFDTEKWTQAFASRHDWYRVIYPEFDAILAKYEGSDLETRKASRKAIYGLAEVLLRENKVILGAIGKNWDAERKPIDRIVIHHTNVESGITWERISAMQLMRLYAKSYLSPSTEKEIMGTPVYSKHFRGERPVFYGYHWLVRTDGSAERLLNDDEVGWHAGDWEVNCRSIAICLDGDFRTTKPEKKMIEGVRRIISTYYKNVRAEHVIPHRVTNPKTTCPGEWFETVNWRLPY